MMHISLPGICRMGSGPFSEKRGCQRAAADDDGHLFALGRGRRHHIGGICTLMAGSQELSTVPMMCLTMAATPSTVFCSTL